MNLYQCFWNIVNAAISLLFISQWAVKTRIIENESEKIMGDHEKYISYVDSQIFSWISNFTYLILVWSQRKNALGVIRGTIFEAWVLLRGCVVRKSTFAFYKSVQTCIFRKTHTKMCIPVLQMGTFCFIFILFSLVQRFFT